MQLEHLKSFHLAATLKSISKAAAVSHLSQPALSQQIQRLEEEIGTLLFERSNKGVTLTQAGEIVGRYAEHFLSLYENLTADLKELDLSNKTVRIAATTVVGIYGIPCTLFKVKETFPNYNFDLATAHSYEVERSILQGECDVGFIIGQANSPALISKKVYSDNILLVAKYNYGAPASLSLDDIKNFPLLMLQQGSSLRAKLDQHLKSLEYSIDEFNITFSLDSTESVKSLVLNGGGLAFLPYISVKKELYLKQLKEIAVPSFPFGYDIHIIYKRSDQNNALSTLIQYMAEIVEKTFC